MKKVACDGCGMGEPLDLPDSKRKIRPVTMKIQNDQRDNFPESAELFSADLCDDCVGIIKHGYFSVLAEGQLNVPAFIEPTDAERARMEAIDRQEWLPAPR